MDGRYHNELLRLFGPDGKHMLILDPEGPWVAFKDAYSESYGCTSSWNGV